MGKKYLDTKQSTIEAAVLDVWAKSSEEQEAIRNAAEMMVQEKISDSQSEGWLAKKVQKERDKLGAQAAGSKKPDPGHAGPPPAPQPKEPPKPSIIGAIKNVWKRLTNGDFIGMTAYLNTLNEDQSSDQIAVVIGDINETELTLINPDNLDQTTKINLENLQVDINEDGELEFSEGWFTPNVSAAAKDPHSGHNIPALKQYNLEVDLAKKQSRNWKPGTPGAPKVPKEYKLPHQK